MKTLFIGNSHTYFNDMPEIFRRICLENGIDMQVAMLTRGGIGLHEHAKEPQTRFNILYGGYDFIVLQHTAHPIGNLDDMYSGAEQILGFIRQTKSIPVFYQTWAKKGDEDYQSVMSDIYYSLGRKFGVKVAPVGDVWQQTRKNNPDAELFYTDGQHASEKGSALAARVIFETIFNKN